jgi:nucleoside-diphosphate-sugar epimerase
MPMNRASAVLVTGSTGRVGGALRAIWPKNQAGGLPILWHGRKSGPGVDLAWNIGQIPPATLPRGLIILHLAGLTSGSPQDLYENSVVTEAICAAAEAALAVHVFVMSSAAVYQPAPHWLRETDLAAPLAPYGAAKLAAERVAQKRLGGRGLTVLRLANLAGADALFGNCLPGRTLTLDPVPGQSGGPERSYIGPHALAEALTGLIRLASEGAALPDILNLAQPGVMAMADLLTAREQPWVFGPPRQGVIARVALNTERLAALVPLAPVTPATLVADLDQVEGWPR